MQPHEPTTLVTVGQLCLVPKWFETKRIKNRRLRAIRSLKSEFGWSQLACRLPVSLGVPYHAVLEAKGGVVDRNIEAVHSWWVVVQGWTNRLVCVHWKACAHIPLRIVASSTGGIVEDPAGEEPICYLGDGRRSRVDIEAWTVIGVCQVEGVPPDVGPVGEAGAVVHRLQTFNHREVPAQEQQGQRSGEAPVRPLGLADGLEVRCLEANLCPECFRQVVGHGRLCESKRRSTWECSRLTESLATVDAPWAEVKVENDMCDILYCQTILDPDAPAFCYGWDDGLCRFAQERPGSAHMRPERDLPGCWSVRVYLPDAGSVDHKQVPVF
mmetsp:Transcript_145325/g.205714  ORF Transcript_145325/g.205714 Transcript_145325/m.205714 type:complete len:326 (+) Transcript_145325:129-1106(+)